jgi:hypothetical protein
LEYDPDPAISIEADIVNPATGDIAKDETRRGKI